MQRTTVWAPLLAIVVLLTAFALTPAAKVDRGIGEYKPDFARGLGDARPEKSGLRVAIEGRLRWLGF
jgi:hypothetical protein